MQGNPTLVEVMSYLPPADGNDKMLLRTQDTDDLKKAISKSHLENLKFAKKIAFLFKGENEYDTCKNIWNFIKKYIPYSVEPVEKQCIKSIPRILQDARMGMGSDCKMYSVLSGCILKSLRIPFKYRLTGWVSSKYPQHIYCVTDKYIIDGVLPFFNYEKNNYKYKKDMALYNLSGVDKIGKLPTRKQLKEKVKKFTKGALDKAKVVGAAIPRNAFLLILNTNARGIATKLSKLDKKSPNKLIDLWVKKFGGNIDNLRAAIRNGEKRKPFLGGKMSGDDESLGFDPASITAALVTAAPIILAVIKAMKDDGIPTEDVPTGDITPPDEGTGYDKSPSGENNPERDYTEAEKEKISEKVSNQATGNDKPSDKPADDKPADDKKDNKMLYIGAAALVGLYLFTKK